MVLNVLGIAIIREVSVRSFAANLGSTKANQYLRPLARYHHSHMDCYVSKRLLDGLLFLNPHSQDYIHYNFPLHLGTAFSL